LVLGARYRFVAFDGLNRFYVSEECAHLAQALELPPNPHDDYVPHEYQTQIDALKHKLAEEGLPVRIARGMVSSFRALRKLALGRAR
jgi:hypothetical protein